MKNEELMKKAADIINEEFSEQVAVYEKIDVEIPQEQDEMLLEMARKADRERKNREKIRRSPKNCRTKKEIWLKKVFEDILANTISKKIRARIQVPTMF